MRMERKLKVLIIHNYYQIPGGEDTVVENEKKLLEDHRHEVILYSRNNSEIKSFSILQKLLLPVTTVFNLRTYRDVKKIIQKNKVDIVHVHNTLNLVSPSVYYAAFSCKVPVVQTIHNFRLLCPGATFYRDGHICEDCVSKGLLCAVKHSCYRHSKLQTLACVISTWFHRKIGTFRKLNYICLTTFNREKLLLLNKLGKKPLIDPLKIFVKPNFTFEVPVGKTTNEYYLFIGRIEEIKGMDILLDAFSKMPELSLVIAGTGTQVEKYKQVASKNVSFAGFLNKNDLTTAIKRAKAVIVPSQWYETFGMIIAETYAAHKPVIVGDIGNVSALIKDYATGLRFKYNSVKDLISTVKAFESANTELWGENAYTIFKQCLSPESNYYQLIKIYKQVRKS